MDRDRGGGLKLLSPFIDRVPLPIFRDNTLNP
jgi:hypothetical protein